MTSNFWGKIILSDGLVYLVKWSIKYKGEMKVIGMQRLFASSKFTEKRQLYLGKHPKVS